MNLFPKVFLNTAVQVLGRGAVILIALAVTSILTRNLGTSGYGNYVFITAVVFLFASIADWGTGIISVREAAKSEKHQAKIFGNALISRFLIAIFLFLLFNLLIRLLPQFKNLVLPASVASFLLLTLSLRTSFQIVFQTKIRFERQVMVEIFSAASFFLLLLWAMKIPSLFSIFMALTFSSVLACLLGFLLARKTASFDFSLEGGTLKALFWEALPTGALLFLFSIYNRLDIFILQTFQGSTAVGIYGLSYKIHENLILGAAYLMNVLFPIISRFSQNPQGKLPLIYKKTFDILVLSGLLVFLLVFPFTTLIIKTLAGSSFSASGLVLKILVLATFVSFLNHLTGYTLIALGKQRVSLAVAAGALLLNLSLNLIFIPRFSFMAAAVITVVTEAFVFSLTSFYLARRFKLFPSFSFLKTAREFIVTRGKIF